MEVISVCLSDIPKDKIRRASNGKCYINIAIVPLRQEDEHGNSITSYVQQTKEEREAKQAKVYLGKGRVFDFDRPKPVTPESVDSMPVAGDVDDLPF